MYFQNANVIKIDIIRQQIEKWNNDGLLNEDEYFYLLAMLLNAVPFVANITGTFGAYLKFWDVRTYNPITLQRHKIEETDKPQKKIIVLHLTLDFTKGYGIVIVVIDNNFLIKDFICVMEH